MTKFTQLPQEIQSTIVSLLASDTPALLSIALTCRSLLPRAQQHLFANLILTRNEKIQTRSYPGPSRALTAQQLHAILAVHPHIASYVRRLELVGLYDKWNAEEEEDARGSDAGLGSKAELSARALKRVKQQHAALAFCLPLFARLQALIVALDERDTAFTFSRRVLASLIALLNHAASSLTYLDLTEAPAVALWYCPAGIKHLSLKLCDFVIPPREWDAVVSLSVGPPAARRPPIFLDSLRVCLEYDDTPEEQRPQSRPGGVHSWLFHPANRVKLTKLRKLVVEANEDIEEHLYTSRILAECASTLQEFAFNPSEAAYDPDGIDEPITLANLPALEKFSARTSTWSLGWYTRLLSTVPTSGSSRIQHLMLHVLVRTAEDMADIMISPAPEWRALVDVVLAPGRFPCLRKVHLRWALAERGADRLVTGESKGEGEGTGEGGRVGLVPGALLRLEEAGVLEVDFLRGRGAWDRELSVFPPDPAWDASIPRLTRAVDYVDSL